MKQISIDELAETLNASTITETATLAGILIHKVNHPELGNLITAQAGENNAVLISI